MSANAETIATPRTRTRTRVSAAAHATLLDRAGYWIALAASYLGLMSLWYDAAQQKIVAGHFTAPAGIVKQFHGSLIASVPGTSVAWAILAVCEALVFLGLVVSLARGEFLPSRPKSWFLGSSLGSLFVLALLIFGDSMTGQHAGVPELFGYLAATILLIALVRAMPPYRSRRWLTNQQPNQPTEQD
jgi:hypothetical protein